MHKYIPLSLTNKQIPSSKDQNSKRNNGIEILW